MSRTVKRKCKKCNQPMEINKMDVRGVICFKNFYYHVSCFCELAKKNSQSTDGRKRPQDWKAALENISALEADTRKILQQHLGTNEVKDALNDYLLDTYDIVTTPDKRFWQTVADLSNGEYKKKRCKKVSTQTLLDTWKWMQHKLDDINRYNRANHKGPMNDRERIPYDLAIVVKGIPDYLAYKAQSEAEEVERRMAAARTEEIDFSKIKTVTYTNNGIDDLSEILDEFM